MPLVADTKVLFHECYHRLLKEVGDGENDYNFSLTSEALRSMFQGVADKIIAATRDVIRRSKKEPDVILLVGGLGTNNYLAERVQESFAAHVCTPTYGHVAVLSGVCQINVKCIHQTHYRAS